MGYIKNLYEEKDGRAFRALSRVGHCSQKQLKSCGLTPTRIKNYCLDGYVEKVKYNLTTKGETAYKLTELGKQTCMEQFGCKALYHAQSPNHDMDLANKYFSLTHEEQDTVKTETELRWELESKIEELKQEEETRQQAEEWERMLQEHKISAPDFAYTTTVEEREITIAYETITSNYNQEQIVAKEVAAEILNYELEEQKV